MDDFIWKNEKVINKIVFVCGWFIIWTLPFWFWLWAYNSRKDEEKFFNPRSFRIIWIYGLVVLGIVLLGIIFGIIESIIS